MAVAAVAAAGWVGGCGSGDRREHARITVSPATALTDAPRRITVSGLRPRQVVTVAASTIRAEGRFASQARLRADQSGVVDLGRADPLSGSYHGVAGLGLLFSELRRGRRSLDSGRPPLTTTLTVSARGRRLGSATLVQTQRAAGVSVRRLTIRGDGLAGEYFAPPATPGAPAGDGAAVVMWGGSEGGLHTSEPALIASHGIPVLSLAYFDGPGLPCSLHDIALEYFARGIRWLRERTGVDPGRVWVLSGSRGTEAELLVAGHWPGLVHGLIAESPSSIVYGSTAGRCRSRGQASWTLGGRQLPFTVSGRPAIEPGGALDERAGFMAGLDDPAARAAAIPVGGLRLPVLLISGDEDRVWPSSVFAGRLMAGLHDDPARHVWLRYAGAGHTVLGVPSLPTPTQARGAGGRAVDLGGTPEADDAAYRRDWPAMLRFIERD